MKEQRLGSFAVTPIRTDPKLNAKKKRRGSTLNATKEDADVSKIDDFDVAKHSNKEDYEQLWMTTSLRKLRCRPKSTILEWITKGPQLQYHSNKARASRRRMLVATD